MKKIILILPAILLSLASCTNITSLSNTSIESSDTSTSTSTSTTTSTSSTTSTTTDPTTLPTTTDPTTTDPTTSIDPSIPTDPTPDNSPRLAIPTNIDNKLILENNIRQTFEFKNDIIPDNWRTIFGYKFGKVPQYAESYGYGLEFKISNSGAGRGIQSPMFTCSLKLEIDLEIGKLSNSNNVVSPNDKRPVFSVYGFSSTGQFIRSVDLFTLDKGNENHSKKLYMSGVDISYLEIKMLRNPYKSQQAYNCQLLGISLVSYPYEYKE
ncbi:MAG: hypothetical protein RSD40_00025 [Bacilli bacterium]